MAIAFKMMATWTNLSPSEYGDIVHLSNGSYAV
jgi:hypothetical protein